MDYYLLAFKKYTDFSGRATRVEYWYFYLVNLLISFALTFFSKITGILYITLSPGVDISIIATLYSLGVLLPGLAVSVRRLHDVGKSGWMMFISIIPLIGAIWLIVLLVRDSVQGENEYGPNPKEKLI